MPKKILLFGDFGIDDIIALVYAHYEPEIEAVGIVADYGNVPKETAIRNAAFIQQLIGREDVPIIEGALLSLTGEAPTYYPEVHGPEGLGPFIPSDGVTFTFENFHKIYEIIEQYAGELTIVNIGRLTSLATAYVLYPETMKKVKNIYVMGGAFFVPGNVTPLAEANFHGDPIAANLVITLAEKINIIPLNVTLQAIMTPEMVDYIDWFHTSLDGNSIGVYIKPLLDYYYEFYKKNTPDIQGSPLHDVLALWAVINQPLMTYMEKPVAVEPTLGESRGVSYADLRPYEELAHLPVHRFAVAFNYERFIRDVIDRLTMVEM